MARGESHKNSSTGLNAAGDSRQYRIPLWFFAFIPNRIASGLIAPLAPLFIVQVLQGNLTDVGWVASLTSLASGPTSILWGNLSDRIQRRLPFIFAGLLSFGVFTVLTGLASSVPQILAYSAFGALIGTAIGPTSSALMIEGLPEEKWALSFGWFNQIGGLSYVAGMVIGTIWLQWIPAGSNNEDAIRGLYLLAGGMAMTSPLLAMAWIKESHRTARPGIPVRKEQRQPAPVFSRLFYWSWLHNFRRYLSRPIGHYLIFSFLMFFGINVAFMPFPLFLSQALHASNSQVFLINMVKSVVDTFFFVPVGRWLVHQRGVTLQAKAAGVRAVLFGICALLALIQAGQSGLIVIVLVQIMNGVTWAAISVSGPTAVAGFTERGTEARAIGTYNATLGIAGILGNLAAGYIVQYMGYVVSFSVAAALMILSGALMGWLAANRRQIPGDEVEA